MQMLGGSCFSNPWSFAVSLLLALVSTRLFSWTRGVCQNTSHFSHYSSVLCLFDTLAVSFFTFAAKNTACFQYLFFQNWQNCEMFVQHLRHPTQDIYHLILPCPPTDSLRRILFGNFYSLYDLWSRPWGVNRLLSSTIFRHAPIPREEKDNNNNNDTY